ncbi:MAG: hypothetical protein ABFS28_03410 [Bacteroidota bacterium]
MFLKIFNTKASNYRISIVLVTLILVITAGNFLGCETEDWVFEVDCNDCYGYMPDSAKLIVYLTIDSENDSVPITFYRGDYENGEIDWQDTATTEEFFLYSEMNREYTVAAEYKSGVKTIIAFDKDEMFLYDAAAECGSPCYIVKGGIFDVRLLK